MIERENGIYEFAHKSFQEYLAAVQIKESNQEQILISNINNSWWDETIRLYATQSDATNLIRAALDNPTVVSLKLALDCQEEGLRIEPDVRRELTDRLAAGLESHQPEIFKLAAEVKLARRLSNLLRIDEDLEIDHSYITCAEYRLFLNFFGGLDGVYWKFSPFMGDVNKPITNIYLSEANRFCAWLIQNFTQQNPLEKTTGYRLATETERLKFPIADDAQLAESGIRLVRFQLPSLYSQLCYFLAAGKWREADEETSRVMLKVANREQQGYLDVDDIRNFPCRDLRIIDQLWVNYSNGRFGFSVQKRIWIEVGGKYFIKYKDNNKIEILETTYLEFSDRVGWRRDGSWLDYDQIAFTLDAPAGQFPSGVWEWRQVHIRTESFISVKDVVGRMTIGGKRWVRWKGCFLFSHLKTCRL